MIKADTRARVANAVAPVVIVAVVVTVGNIVVGGDWRCMLYVVVVDIAVAAAAAASSAVAARIVTIDIHPYWLMVPLNHWDVPYIHRSSSQGVETPEIMLGT